MSAAGEYDRRYEWLRQAIGAYAGTGTGGAESRTTWPTQGYLWGAADEPSAGETVVMESKQSETTGTIRLRNLPAIRKGDVLYDHGYGEAWRVDASRRGADELVCQVTRCNPTAPYGPVRGA